MKQKVSAYKCPACSREVLVTDAEVTTAVACVNCRVWMVWEDNREEDLNMGDEAHGGSPCFQEGEVE